MADLKEDAINARLAARLRNAVDTLAALMNEADDRGIAVRFSINLKSLNDDPAAKPRYVPEVSITRTLTL